MEQIKNNCDIFINDLKSAEYISFVMDNEKKMSLRKDKNSTVMTYMDYSENENCSVHIDKYNILFYIRIGETLR